jgi:large subunit ribosomal protein L18
MKMTKAQHRQRIHYRIRKKVNGTAEKPRLAVYRSNKGIYCQLINDDEGHTLAAATFKEVTYEGSKIVQSAAVGKLIAEKAAAVGVTKAVFDRGGYLYHGRIKAVAEGAREGGLAF